MGIKICPQCGGKVSDIRNNCPHCQYDFASVKKCPDCEEQIDVSLAECPICGHFFEKETSSQDTTVPLLVQNENSVQVEQPVQKAQHEQDTDTLVCPYCGITEPMQIGNDLYMCAVCKNRFMDTRGLPTPEVWSKKTADIASSESENNTSKASSVPEKEKTPSKKDGSGKYTPWLWIAAGWTLLGYVINLVIALCVGGYPAWMFQYIFAGYIAGFICMGVGVIAFVILLILTLKQRACPRIHVILTSLLLAITLIVTFIPLAAEAKYDFKYHMYDRYNSYGEIMGDTTLSITALKDPRSECLVIPSEMHGEEIYSVSFNLPETQSGSSQGMVAAPQAQSGSGKAQEIAHVTTLVFSNGIKEIYSLPTNLPDLKTIVIPVSVTVIGWEFIADLESHYRTYGTRIDICYVNDPICGANTLTTYKIQIGTEYIETKPGLIIQQPTYRYPDSFSTHRYDNCNHGHIK